MWWKNKDEFCPVGRAHPTAPEWFVFSLGNTAQFPPCGLSTAPAAAALRIMRYCLYKTFHGTSFWEYPPVGAHADVSPYRRTKYQPDVHSNLYGLLVGNTSRTFLPCPPCGYLICRFLLLFLGVGFDTGIPAAKATVLWRRGFCLPGIESAGRFWYTVG